MTILVAEFAQYVASDSTDSNRSTDCGEVWLRLVFESTGLFNLCVRDYSVVQMVTL